MEDELKIVRDKLNEFESKILGLIEERINLGNDVANIKYKYVSNSINLNDNEEIASDYAASWVKEANIKRGLNIKFWEIGNENWGKWQAGYEVKDRGIIDPQKYGQHCKVFIEKMKNLHFLFLYLMNLILEEFIRYKNIIFVLIKT